MQLTDATRLIITSNCEFTVVTTQNFDVFVKFLSILKFIFVLV